ncbi:MAG: flagellar biosynthesis anti-sigma factor FlgM [Blastocatellia bacterium]
MKINQINIANLAEKIDLANKINNNKKTTTTDQNSKVIGFPKDSVNFSDATKEIQKLTEKVIETPNVRQEKVEDLRSKIASGEFNPSASKILDAIIKNEL